MGRQGGPSQSRPAEMRREACSSWARPRSVGTLLHEVLERHLDHDAVVGAADDRGLPQHVLPYDLAVALDRRHSRPDAWQPAAQLEIGLVLVAQATLQAAAHPGELRWVQREPL